MWSLFDCYNKYYKLRFLISLSTYCFMLGWLWIIKCLLICIAFHFDITSLCPLIFLESYSALDINVILNQTVLFLNISYGTVHKWHQPGARRRVGFLKSWLLQPVAQEKDGSYKTVNMSKIWFPPAFKKNWEIFFLTLFWPINIGNGLPHAFWLKCRNGINCASCVKNPKGTHADYVYHGPIRKMLVQTVKKPRAAAAWKNVPWGQFFQAAPRLYSKLLTC